MKRLALLCTAIAILSQPSVASPKSDSIVAFTGSRTKIVWLRFTFRNADYSAMNQATATAAGQSVMLFDTDEGQERVLGTGLTTRSTCFLTDCQVQDNVRISRSGHWATVADLSSTYIFDLTGTNPNKRVFLAQSNCAYWCVKAWGRDAGTGKEYVYTLKDFNSSTGTYLGSAIYKVPVNADGTADVGNATQVPINGSPKIDGALSVSADLKKIGGEFPWPDNPGILDVATGAIAVRKNMAACHTNIAADSSYRFFHLNDDHNGIYMWDKNMSTTNWYIDLQQNMVNNLRGAFWCPRWSNNAQFIATTYPADDLGDNYGQYWTISTAADMALKVGDVQFCVLHKLSADLRSITQSMAAITDNRSYNFLPDVWMASGYTGGPVATSTAPGTHRRAAELESPLGRGALDLTHLPAHATVRTMDAQGRVVAQRFGTEAASIDLRELDPGAYVVSTVTRGGIVSKRVTVVR